MSKKYDINYVKNFIEVESNSGCYLLDETFTDINQKLNIRCECGVIFQASFAKFLYRDKRQCNTCGFEKANNKQRLDYLEVKKYVEHESSCLLVSSEYSNSNTKLAIQCECGVIFYISFSKFKYLKNKRCNSCNGKNSWTADSVKTFITKNSDCKLISNYTNSSDVLVFECGCGELFKTSFTKFNYRNKRQCNKCSFKGMNLKWCEESIRCIFPKILCNYKLLSVDYRYNNGFIAPYVLLKCEDLEHSSYWASWYSVVSKNHGCKQCANKKLSINNLLTHEEFLEKATERISEYDIVGKYINAKTKISFRHKSCGKDFLMTPNQFLNGGSCPYCSSKKIKNHQTFIDKVEELVGEEYSVLGEYKTTKIKIRMKHNNCGSEWDINPSNFIHNGRRCPICNESKGEKVIKEYLNSNSIYYERQYTFSDCKRKEVLPFDFAVFEDKEMTQIKLLIEYDGEFHYLPIMGAKKLKYQQENDNIKNQYCKENNIKLLRIPYWEIENIDLILAKELMS